MNKTLEDSMDPNWVLREFKVERVTFGKKKGTYIGRVSFRNDNYDCFDFKLSEEETREILKILTPKILDTASKLHGRIEKSLNYEEVVTNE